MRERNTFHYDLMSYKLIWT